MHKSAHNSTIVAIVPSAPARASSVASHVIASPQPRSVFASSTERGKEMRHKVKRRPSVGLMKEGPVELFIFEINVTIRLHNILLKKEYSQLNSLPMEMTAETINHPARTLRNINRGVCVADLIRSSAAANTCRALEKGIPSEAFLGELCARRADIARENPSNASGDFFRYSNRLRHRSMRGVAKEGTAEIIDLKKKRDVLI